MGHSDASEKEAKSIRTSKGKVHFLIARVVIIPGRQINTDVVFVVPSVSLTDLIAVGSGPRGTRSLQSPIPTQERASLCFKIRIVSF